MAPERPQPEAGSRGQGQKLATLSEGMAAAPDRVEALGSGLPDQRILRLVPDQPDDRGAAGRRAGGGQR